MGREREDRCKRRRRRERENRPSIQGREAERKEVAKHAGTVPRKAAIVYEAPVPETDTGG